VDDSNDVGATLLAGKACRTVRFEKSSHSRSISIAYIMEFNFGALAASAVKVTICYRQDSGEDITKAVAQVVYNDYIVPSFQEFQGCMASNESEAAGDENKVGLLCLE
jgi:hypothetical protein